jgi:hypothetical protein
MSRRLALALIVAASIMATPTAAQRASCKAVTSCAEAVRMWCDGYAGADRDHDGIPCENVCKSRAQVQSIMAEIGCAR